MKVLGSITITPVRQRTIAEGVAWDIPRSHIKLRILARAQIGDLLWVREPFVEFTSHASVRPAVHEIARGCSPLNVKIPAKVKRFADRMHMRVFPASALPKSDSMATLEIMGISDAAVRVQVHLEQVDVFLKSRRAE